MEPRHKLQGFVRILWRGTSFTGGGGGGGQYSPVNNVRGDIIHGGTFFTPTPVVHTEMYVFYPPYPYIVCIGYILSIGCCIIYIHDRGPQAQGSYNKVTYTEVCNILLPWQQEMQLSQELQDCTCIIQATCKRC